MESQLSYGAVLPQNTSSVFKILSSYSAHNLASVSHRQHRSVTSQKRVHSETRELKQTLNKPVKVILKLIHTQAKRLFMMLVICIAFIPQYGFHMLKAVHSCVHLLLHSSHQHVFTFSCDDSKSSSPVLHCRIPFFDFTKRIYTMLILSWFFYL